MIDIGHLHCSCGLRWIYTCQRTTPQRFFAYPIHGYGNYRTMLGGRFMSSRQQNAGLTTLYVLLFAQVVCFFLNAVDNFFAVFSLTFGGHKGAALAKPVVQVNNVVLRGHTLMWVYLICCLRFFYLPIG